MTIVFIQTADSFYYNKLLETSSVSVREYCLQRGFLYEQYQGECLGNMPWKASYNRIHMLEHLLSENFGGWVFYMDADAFIVDFDFDFYGYLYSVKDKAAVFCGYLNGIKTHVNSGGFAINYGHPVGRQLVSDYISRYNDIGQRLKDEAMFWEKDISDDQALLWQVLGYIEQFPELDATIVFEDWKASIVNNGRFIEQALRSHHGASLSRRIEYVAGRSVTLNRGYFDIADGEKIVIDMHSSHPRLRSAISRKIFGVLPFSTEESGCIFYGPYVALPAGNYKAYAYGILRQKSETSLYADIVANLGSTIVQSSQFDLRETNLVRLEVPFRLDRDQSAVEFRVFSRGKASGYFHRIRITSVQR